MRLEDDLETVLACGAHGARNVLRERVAVQRSKAHASVVANAGIRVNGHPSGAHGAHVFQRGFDVALRPVRAARVRRQNDAAHLLGPGGRHEHGVQCNEDGAREDPSACAAVMTQRRSTPVHSETSTPFQKATWSLISLAASLGSG